MGLVGHPGVQVRWTLLGAIWESYLPDGRPWEATIPVRQRRNLFYRRPNLSVAPSYWEKGGWSNLIHAPRLKSEDALRGFCSSFHSQGGVFLWDSQGQHLLLSHSPLLCPSAFASSELQLPVTQQHEECSAVSCTQKTRKVIIWDSSWIRLSEKSWADRAYWIKIRAWPKQKKHVR